MNISKWPLIALLAPTAAFAIAVLPPKESCERELDLQPFVKLAEQASVARARESRAQARRFEDLVRPAPPIRVTSSSCFTGRMRVLTMHGYVRISELREGDWVYSLDLVTHRIVPSRIARIRKTEGQSYGILRDFPVPIEVTNRHRFHAERTGFAAVEDLRPADQLLYLDARAELAHLARGRFVASGKIETVYEISLNPGPHNYFVEGVLVHNVKIEE